MLACGHRLIASLNLGRSLSLKYGNDGHLISSDENFKGEDLSPLNIGALNTPSGTYFK
jgi:hypothetical protein